MKKPLVIGHRGASGESPENTMLAFELALTQKADGIELDIFKTKDGHIVVTHDENTFRLAGKKLWVRKSTLKELRELDFGSSEKIPTLDDVLSHFGKKFSHINIEIKSTGYASDGIEFLLDEILKKQKPACEIVVSSFNPLHLWRLKKINPQIKRGYLLNSKQSFTYNRSLINLINPETININIHRFTPKDLIKLSTYNSSIWLWTVNQPDEMKSWILPSVSAMITNFPGVLKSLIDNKKS